VRVAIPVALLHADDLRSVEATVEPRVTLIPAPRDRDPSPITPAEIAETTGPLRVLAERLVDADPVHAEAARLYEIGTRHFPLEDRYWSGLGIALWRAGDDARLRPVLEYLTGREYDNAGIRKKLAEIAAKEERYEEAVRWGREALEPGEEGLVLGHVHPCRQGVDEQAHHLLDPRELRRPPGRGGPEEHVRGAGVAGEEERPGPLEEGVQGQAVPPRQLAELGGQGPGQVGEVLGGARLAGSAAVDRERRGAGEAGELAAPEGLGGAAVLAR